MKRVPFLRVLLAVLVLAAACGGGRGGEGESAPPPAETASPDGLEVSWTGYVTKAYPIRLGVVLRATRSALDALRIDVLSEQEGTFSRDLEAVTREGTELIVSIAEVRKDETRVKVKVGYLLGNRDAARRIHSEIASELGRIKAGDVLDPWQVPTRSSPDT